MALIFLNREAASLPTFSQSGNSGKGVTERGTCFAALTLKTELLRKVKIYKSVPTQKAAAVP